MQEGEGVRAEDFGTFQMKKLMLLTLKCEGLPKSPGSSLKLELQINVTGLMRIF